jgi:hypothetical protein
MCFKILYFSRVRNWLGPIFFAAIIMIFVSCTNINEYVRNYQDCLTLILLYFFQYIGNNSLAEVVYGMVRARKRRTARRGKGMGEDF